MTRLLEVIGLGIAVAKAVAMRARTVVKVVSFMVLKITGLSNEQLRDQYCAWQFAEIERSVC
jgi:hypothetical protein